MGFPVKDRSKGGLDRLRTTRGHTGIGRGPRSLFCGQGIGLSGDGNRGQAFDLCRQRAQVAGDVLGVEHTANQVRRTFRQTRQHPRQRNTGGRVVAPVEPELGLGRLIRKRPFTQPLHPGGPFCPGNRSLIGRIAKFKIAQRGQSSPGVVDLMRPRQVREGQVAQSGVIGIDKPPAFFLHVPVLTVNQQRRANTGRLLFDHLKRRILLRTDDAGYATLEDTRLFKSDLFQRFAKELLVVDGNRGNHAKRGLFNDIGRIETPAKTDFEQGIIRLRPGKGQKRGTGRDLEIGDRAIAIGPVAFIKNLCQYFFGNQVSGQPDAFVKPGKMRRGINMSALARALDPGADHCKGRPLAIGPRDMDHRRQ